MTVSKIISGFFGDYRFLSNFYPSVIRVGDIEYPTVEHAYQAAKTTSSVVRARIALAETPNKAKRLGQTVVLRPHWDERKVHFMKKCLVLKFEIPDLRRRLLATGSSTLVEENTWGDRFWGVCGGEGENNLGKLLMEVRAECQSQDH